jgi:hypothetical protein
MVLAILMSKSIDLLSGLSPSSSLMLYTYINLVFQGWGLVCSRLVFSRVLRDSISRYVGRSVGRSVRQSVRPSVGPSVRRSVRPSVGRSTVSVAVSPHATRD